MVVCRPVDELYCIVMTHLEPLALQESMHFLLVEIASPFDIRLSKFVTMLTSSIPELPKNSKSLKL